MQAIVLAGQKNVALKTVSSCAWEAEIPVLGRPLVDWVIAALKAATAVDEEIIVVGPPSIGERNEVTLAPLGETLWDNLHAGLAGLPPGTDRVLICTADVPLLTGPIIDDFVIHAPAEADLVYPVVSRGRTVDRYPETRRTYVRLRGKTVTGGNLIIARPSVLRRIEERAQQLIRHRKSPVQLARDVGPLLLLRLLTGQLSLAQAERRVSRVFGIQGRVVESPYPEIGLDVDKPHDLSVVLRALAEPASDVRHAQGRR